MMMIIIIVTMISCLSVRGIARGADNSLECARARARGPNVTCPCAAADRRGASRLGDTQRAHKQQRQPVPDSAGDPSRRRLMAAAATNGRWLMANNLQLITYNSRAGRHRRRGATDPNYARAGCTCGAAAVNCQRSPRFRPRPSGATRRRAARQSRPSDRSPVTQSAAGASGADKRAKTDSAALMRRRGRRHRRRAGR